MLKLEGLKSKQENGITVYFYAGLGWVTEERLNQPDVAKNEEAYYQKFMRETENQIVEIEESDFDETGKYKF